MFRTKYSAQIYNNLLACHFDRSTRVVFDPAVRPVRLGDFNIIRKDGSLKRLFNVLEKDVHMERRMIQRAIPFPPAWSLEPPVPTRWSVNPQRSLYKKGILASSARIEGGTGLEVLTDSLTGGYVPSPLNATVKLQFMKKKAAFLALEGYESKHEDLDQALESEAKEYIEKYWDEITNLCRVFEDGRRVECCLVTSVDLCYGITNGVIRNANQDGSFYLKCGFAAQLSGNLLFERLGTPDCHEYARGDRDSDPQNWDFVFAFQGRQWMAMKK